MGNITINGVTRVMTAEEQAEYDTRVAEREATKSQRQLEEIKELRLERLQATDFMASSDYVMPDNIKTWRKTLRDIPQDYSEEQYDELLDRDKEYNLTHTVWSKP
tara:strand:- start:18 stop:332 length:315 start_codon:yes stop_codon:yes gene_type:complete